MKIIIIGAGIAGLTFGIAARRRGFDVKIYEKTNELRNIGGGLILWPEGIRYLNWMGAGDCLRPYQINIKRCNIIGLDGTRILSEDCTEFTNLINGDILPIERTHLQQALLSQLPSSSLIMGKKCVEVSSEKNQARVIFSDGTSDTADLIVGADGIHSAVRTFLYPDFLPTYTNLCWWGGIVDKKVLANLSANESYCYLSLSKCCIIWPVTNDKCLWYFPVKMPEADFLTTADGLAQLRNICGDWNKDIHSLLAAPTTQQNFHFPIYTLSPRPQWSEERITLIGDAAHALGPMMAQGTSLAIEDAFLLALCLEKNSDDVANALKHYESVRFEKYQQLYAMENQTAALMTMDQLPELEQLQNQLANANLTVLYKDLIPLINKEASLNRISSITTDAIFV